MNYALFIVHPDGFEHYAGCWAYRQQAKAQGRKVVDGHALDYRVAKMTPTLRDLIDRGWWHDELISLETYGDYS